MMDMKEFLGILKSRRSVRTFTDRVPDKQRLATLIEAAQWAPSNHNRQGWKFLVFLNQSYIKELSQRVRETLTSTLATANHFVAAQGQELIHFATLFENAPVVILAMHKKSPAVGQSLLDDCAVKSINSEAISTAMAVQNLLLAAHVMGLGACVMTAPLLAGSVWQSLPDLPMGFEPTCLIAVGYPAETSPPPRRKPTAQIVEFR
jgi:coenzyme F420-0:L-glutamate ligase / coenzyme F420-1:gamma-L-glutamate ligase